MTPEIRIRKIFRPISYLIAAVLNSQGVAPNAVAVSSFILAITSFSIFLVAYNISPGLAETLVTIAVLCIFLNALLDDVTREIEKKSGKMSEFGGLLGSFLDRYSDIFIVIGIGIFLKDVPWYNVGVLINIGVDGHMFLVSLIIIGSLIVSYIKTDRPTYDLGLESRAERMYLISIFAATGIYLRVFQGFLFFGLVTLCISLYATVLRTVLGSESRRSETPEIRHEPLTSETENRFQNPLRPAISLIRSILRVIWMGIGLAILGLYQAGAWTKTKIKKIKIPKPNIPVKTEDKTLPPLPEKKGFERNSFTVLVMEENTQRPLPDARVSLISEETENINTNYTDKNGIVVFRNIQEGSYEIEAECNGYEDENRIKYIESHSGGEAITLTPAAKVFEDAIDNTEETPEEITAETKEEDEEPETKPQEIVTETKKPKETKPKTEEEDKDRSKAMGESMLVEYRSPEKTDQVVEHITEFYLEEKRQVILISSQENTKQHKDRFKEEMESGKISLLSPTTKLQHFTEEFQNLPTGGVIVFEPLSDLIKNAGKDQAHKFISQTIDQLSSDGISFIAFLDEESHDRKETTSLENLFINLAKIEEGKLKKIGGL